MGIAPYKTFTFDGKSSGDYGVYITGTGVFNAPERSVEMIEIAGRNGSFALDKGKFENIEVKYKVGIVDDSEADFADRVSDFRNWLCSKVGYCRLKDEYNPNEYRMAVYASGMELEHDLLIAGEAEITFNCKPQRWLTSGETAVSVADGGTLNNPTLFESEPLLAVDGYGTIGFNGYEVEIENVPIGDITLYDGGQWNAVVLDESNLNVGDTIRVNTKMLSPFIETVLTQSMAYHGVQNVSITCSASGYTATFGFHGTNASTHFFYIDIIPTSFTLVSGTNSTITNNVSGSFKVSGSPAGFTLTFSFTQTYTYTASTHKLTYTISNTSVSSSAAWCTPTLKRGAASYYSIIGDSTKSAISDTVYIDCDIGECYTYNSADELVSLNGVISLGSDLPKLASGTNTFTYDNTVTELKVTPRWWKV